jgi:cytochrome c oxidase assembly protein subunit 11
MSGVMLVVGMAGLAYASVPLYRIFCQVTGFGGTTMRADAVPGPVLEREMTVRFDANVADLPWSFQPEVRLTRVKLGENGLVYYRAVNRSSVAIVGTATYNVTPEKAGPYFAKIACFCFTEQRLEPGEAIDMPVSFFVDPALADDPNMEEVGTITLSYTFFKVRDRSPGPVAALPNVADPYTTPRPRRD